VIPLVGATPAPVAIIAARVVVAAVVAAGVVVAGADWPVTLLGLPRYLFGIAGLALPWLNGSLPPRLSGKIICVVQLSVLIAFQLPWLGVVLGAVLAIGIASALVWSFGRNIVWLRRIRSDGKRQPRRECAVWPRRPYRGAARGGRGVDELARARTGMSVRRARTQRGEPGIRCIKIVAAIAHARARDRSVMYRPRCRNARGLSASAS